MITTVLFLVLVGGCAGRVSQTHHAEGYEPRADDGAKYAVGAFVLGAQAELDRQAEIGTSSQNHDPVFQTQTWSPLLYGPLLAARAGSDVWAWSALQENIPGDAITAVQTSYARGSVLGPEMFTELARDLPDIQFLALARIDQNRIEIGSSTPTAMGNQVANESRDPHAQTDYLTRTIRTRRIVTVTMDVYDLRRGRSVWSGSVEKSLTELYSSDDDEAAELVVTPATEEGAEPEIEIKGASLAMPPLDKVLAVACESLVGNLFAIPE